MNTLIIYFSVAVVVSFGCSLLEAIILSVTHAHIELLVRQQSSAGLLLKRLKRRINRPLSAILTVNTVANTVGAAEVGAQALKVFGSEWVALASAVLTFSILVVSEIIPKTLGAVYWKRLAPAAAYTIRMLIFVTYPVVKMFEVLSALLSRGEVSGHITREEMIVVAELSEDEGALGRKETRIIKNLLQLDDLSVSEIMTPRSVLFALQKDETVGDVVKEHSPIRFSRIPVYDKDLDDITGFVHRYKIQEAHSDGRREQPIAMFTSEIHAVPHSISVAAALDELIRRRDQIFIVIDEYGGTAGIVTLEDAVETLLGVEIVDELDSVVDMRKFAVDRWKQRRGRMSADS